MKELTYVSPDDTEFNIPIFEKDGWVSQQNLIDISGKARSTITEHLSTVAEDQGLLQYSLVRKFRTKLSDGRQRETNHYPSTIAILVLFRVNSPNAIHFQMWAAKHILNIMNDGISIEEKIIKQPGKGLSAYKKINKYRLEVGEVISQLKGIILKNSSDSSIHKKKFGIIISEIFNDIYYAVTGMSAVEIINTRANPKNISFGLVTHKHANVRKSDIKIAANYLTEQEQEFVRDIFEYVVASSKVMARTRKTLRLVDWDKHISGFLKLAKAQMLPDNYRYTAKARVMERVNALHDTWKATNKGQQSTLELVTI